MLQLCPHCATLLPITATVTMVVELQPVALTKHALDQELCHSLNQNCTFYTSYLLHAVVLGSGLYYHCTNLNCV